MLDQDDMTPHNHYFYSDSEEFLCGIADGINNFGSEAITAEYEPKKCTDKKYEWVLCAVDKDLRSDTHTYYDGTSMTDTE